MSAEYLELVLKKIKEKSRNDLLVIETLLTLDEEGIDKAVEQLVFRTDGFVYGKYLSSKEQSEVKKVAFDLIENTFKPRGLRRVVWDVISDLTARVESLEDYRYSND